MKDAIKLLSATLLVVGTTQAYAADDADKSPVKPQVKRRVFDASAFLSPAPAVAPAVRVDAGADKSPVPAQVLVDGRVDVLPAPVLVEGSADRSPVKRQVRRQAFNAAAFLSPAPAVLVEGGAAKVDVSPAKPKRLPFNAAAFLAPVRAPVLVEGGAVEVGGSPAKPKRAGFNAAEFLVPAAGSEALAFFNQATGEFLRSINHDLTRWDVITTGNAKIAISSQEQEEAFKNIMGWCLSHYDLASLLPDTMKISNVDAFVEFVVEHVKELYDPLVPGNSVHEIKQREWACLINGFLAYVLQDMNRDNALRAIEEATALIKANPRRAALFATAPAFLPIYAVDKAAVPAPAPAPFMPGSPSQLGGGKVNKKVAGAETSELESKEVYPTPFMSQWMNAAKAETDLAGLTADVAADILKYFASYLDMVKCVDPRERGRYADGGPSTGKGGLFGGKGSLISLSEVLKMQYKVLSQPDNADVLVDAIKFINKHKPSFFNSLTTQNMVN